jgi:intein/homing endonuclease
MSNIISGEFPQGSKMMYNTKFYTDYARFRDDLGRYETWKEAVDRVIDMHRYFYQDKIDDELDSYIEEARRAYNKQLMVGSQRNLQFGGDQVLKHHEKTYNCAFSKVDRPNFFEGCMYFLLCGSGVGFSVQKHHVDQLPKIKSRTNKALNFTIPDSIEGWSEAFAVLLSSFFENGGQYPRYQGKKIHFDFSQIRPKGSYISGGFKAPGSEGLQQSLYRVEKLLSDELRSSSEDSISLRPIVAYDIVMHMADAVLSGGLRRCLPEGSKVFLKDGVKNIENVGIGDQVLTPYGYYRVRNNFHQGSQKTIKLKTQDGNFECTPNHRMAVINGFENYEWKKAEDIIEGDKLITNTFSIEGRETTLPSFTYIKPEKSTTCTDITIPDLDNDMAWFIGYFHGDGYVSYNPRRTSSNSPNNRVECASNKKSKQIIYKIEEQMKRFGVNVSVKDLKNENTCKTTVTSRQLAEYFYENIKKPNSELEIPDFIWNANEEIKLAYVSGLLDADGSPNNKPAIICSTVYNNYAKDLQILLYSCGISTRLRENIKRKNENWQDINYLALINESDYKKLDNPSLVSNLKTNKITRCGNSYSSAYLKESKQIKNKSKIGVFSGKNTSLDALERHGENINFRPVEVLSKESCRQVETYDIEVEEVNQFYCNGYLTHNSATISLFSLDDDEMMKAKTGQWYIDNPQRARSNNSAVLKRDEVTKDAFHNLLQYTAEFGEPGIFFVESKEHGTNPCLMANARLLTPSGIRELGELGEGDKIWSKEGWTKIIKKWSNGVKPVYKFETTGGRFYGTEDHRIVSNGEKIEVKDADSIDICKGFSQKLTINPQDVMDGLVIGDGSWHDKDYKYIILFISPNDYDYFNSEVSSLIHNKRSNKGDYNVSSTIEINELDYTYNRRVPQRFIRSPQKALGFLRGIFSANGSIVNNGKRITLKTSSKNIVEDVQLMLSSLGISSYYTTNKSQSIQFSNGTYVCRENYNVNISTDREKFLNTIGFIQRYKEDKIKLSQIPGKSKKTFDIKEVEFVCEEEVFDITVDNESHTYWTEGSDVSNCGEIGFPGSTSDGRSGFQVCNLTEINGKACTSEETFYEACRAVSILGTLQAGYTHFPFLKDASQEITEQEALLGCSITGWMSNPNLLFDKDVLQNGVKIIKDINKRIAEKLNINPAARCTTVKPSGNTSTLLVSASGIHGEHAPYYLRQMQINENSEMLQKIRETNPKMIEKSVHSATGTDYVISFPITAPENSIYKKDLYGTNQLEYVKKAQKYWVEPGKRPEQCIDSTVTHNVSNTINVDDLTAVGDYLFDNRDYFGGISLMSDMGDRVVPQVPFAQVFSAKELFEMYGIGSLFTSGLIVDALKAFSDSPWGLWTACYALLSDNLDDLDSENVLKHDWVRRAKKFAQNYFNNDLKKLTNCLIDCHRLHSWMSIVKNSQVVDFSALTQKSFTNVDTLAAQSCSGGQCEL